MKIALWVLSGLLAAAFTFTGVNKIANDRATLLANPMMAWANDFSETQIKLIGAAEIAGAAGLILPTALSIAPILTPVAGVGLAALMGGAAATHIGRGENPVPPLVLATLSLVVAVVRFRWLRRREA